jgi:hypothetical protein
MKLLYIFICKWWSFERVYVLSQPNIYSVNHTQSFDVNSYLYDWWIITNRTNERIKGWTLPSVNYSNKRETSNENGCQSGGDI